VTFVENCNQVIAETVFSIVASSFGTDIEGSARNCFRIKNLQKQEILKLIDVWAKESPAYDLQDVKVIIAGDSDDDYPGEYRAEKDRSITWYRNNNERGLVYLETKTESDEQGLKNIFTLQDRNFLDGFFDNSDFNVPETIVERCWNIVSSDSSRAPSFFSNFLLEVLRHIHPGKTQVPVRNFIKFSLASCEAYYSEPGSLTAEQQEEIVGRNLTHLGLFPDSLWRSEGSEARTSRRLELNLSYAELVTTSNSDIEPDDVAKICAKIKFRNIEGEEYSPLEQEYWKKLCIEYSTHRTPQVRGQIPFNIFEQLFAKDVKGLALGDRVEKEIEDADLGRVGEFRNLNVKDGLNKRAQEQAQTLLEADNPDSGLPLIDLLSKQTRRMVEKIASPTPERFFNPLIQLAEVARDFHASVDTNTTCRIEVRLGRNGDETSPSVGLLAFLYGATLRSVSEQSLLNPGGFELTVDDCLLNPKAPSEYRKDTPEDEEEEVHIDWKPVPVEFALVDIANRTELEISSNYEWLPDDYPFFALLWIKVSEQSIQHFYGNLKIPTDTDREEWLSNVCNRTLSLKDYAEPEARNEILTSAPISELADQNQIFSLSSKSKGLAVDSINEYVDHWNDTLELAKIQCIPDGKLDETLEFLLTRDFVEINGPSRVLMLPSHPTRLRWIADYLAVSDKNATLALANQLKLNEKNDKLYLRWLSNLSPHQQPPITVTSERTLLFASGEQGWCEEFSQRNRESTSQGGILDFPSISEMGSQVRAYLDAHPYKQDGLKLLLVIHRGGRLAAELIKEVRKNEFKNARITIHVLAPLDIWEEVIAHFEKLPTENRINEGGKLFPPLQLRLHEFGPDDALSENVLKTQFDIALVPGLQRDELNIQHNTEPSGERQGKFDSLLDPPSSVYGGHKGGEIAVSMIPRASDQLLNNWSTLSVRHARLGPVSKQQPDNTDFIELKIGFQHSAKLYEQLHEVAHWVVLLERYISREQVESLEPQPDVLTVRENVGTSGLYTLIVSSNSGKKFIIHRLKRKLEKIGHHSGMSTDQLTQLAEKIYDETRKISPRLVLQAMGISRVTEEILGLMIAMHLADAHKPEKPRDGVTVWISLDEHLEWFNGSSSTRADLCKITLERVGDQLQVDVMIVEGKFRLAYDHHGVDQVNSTLDLFKSIIDFSERKTESVDARLWREHLLAAMENVNPEARTYFGMAINEVSDDKYRLPENMRSDFRNGNYNLRSMSGLYSICCYSEEGQLQGDYERDGAIQVIKSYKNQVHDLIAGETSKFIQSENQPPVTESSSLVTPPESDRPSENVISSGAEKGTEDVTTRRGKLSEQDLIKRYQMVLDKFGEFGVSVQQPDDPSMRFIEGPASILYRIKPGKAVDPRRLSEKADVLKLALTLDQEQNIRFGNHQGYVTIDVPKSQADRYYVDAADMWKKWHRPDNELAAPLGEDGYGQIVDLNFSSSNSPHLLIGGTTGSGKSEALNTILDGLIRYYGPDEVRLLLVDPKGTELSQYEESSHLEGAIGWDDSDALALLENAVAEMQRRYEKLKEQKTRSLPEYNAKVDADHRIPWWVVVLDEYADLTSEKEMKKQIEAYLKRLAQKARAAGIHVIIATQKPSAEVISTNLRSNLPAQLALRVKSATESRVIIDETGAETLNGKGDALIKAEGKVVRVQCAKT